MSYPKIKTTKRDVTAKELAERFNCSTRTVFRAWSQSRTDYLNENSISRDKPWEQLGISRATWYRRGKPTPPLKTKLHGMQHKITAVKPQQTQAEKAQAQSF